MAYALLNLFVVLWLAVIAGAFERAANRYDRYERKNDAAPRERIRNRGDAREILLRGGTYYVGDTCPMKNEGIDLKADIVLTYIHQHFAEAIRARTGALDLHSES